MSRKLNLEVWSRDGVLNKSSCLNYLLSDQRSDAITDKLRHASCIHFKVASCAYKDIFC